MHAPQFMQSPVLSLFSSSVFPDLYAFSILSGISSIEHALTHLPQRMQAVVTGSVYSLSARNELLVLTYMLLAVWPVVLFAGALVAIIFGIHMIAKVIGEEISKKVRF